jgi:hypothetical protein
VFWLASATRLATRNLHVASSREVYFSLSDKKFFLKICEYISTGSTYNPLGFLLTKLCFLLEKTEFSCKCKIENSSKNTKFWKPKNTKKNWFVSYFFIGYKHISYHKKEKWYKLFTIKKELYIRSYNSKILENYFQPHVNSPTRLLLPPQLQMMSCAGLFVISSINIFVGKPSRIPT